MSSHKFKLIICLGNPGREYENTYHNAGFLFVDYLKENTEAAYSLLATRYFLKSNVFMNESGQFVKKAMKKHGAKAGEVLIAHDDSDIELGKFKLSFGRGSAGHKGIESIIQALGTKDFWRLRIGIRQPDVRGQMSDVRKKAGDFVLRKISKVDKEKLLAVFEKSATAVCDAKSS